jgi:hypothetical protein
MQCQQCCGTSGHLHQCLRAGLVTGKRAGTGGIHVGQETGVSFLEAQMGACGCGTPGTMSGGQSPPLSLHLSLGP